MRSQHTLSEQALATKHERIFVFPNNERKRATFPTKFPQLLWMRSTMSSAASPTLPLASFMFMFSRATNGFMLSSLTGCVWLRRISWTCHTATALRQNTRSLLRANHWRTTTSNVTRRASCHLITGTTTPHLAPIDSHLSNNLYLFVYVCPSLPSSVSSRRFAILSSPSLTQTSPSNPAAR